MIIYLSLLVSLAGLLIYALSSGKAQAAGLAMFECGLLVFLFQVVGSRIVTLGK